MAALYIHIPFCRSKCAYCDFTSFAGRAQAAPRYLRALERELEVRAGELAGRSVSSVYIGGGTPTYLGGEAIAHIMDCARRWYALAPDCEVSCEANPGTVSREGLTLMRRAGVNRLSLGVQAAQDELLRAIGRIHTFAEAREAFEDARAAGFDDVNLDFIYALPGQTPGMWRETLERALELRPEHLSLYSLILEDGTRLKAAVDAGRLALPGEDAELEMASIARELLPGAGYRRYEISNYCLSGRECRHNLLYWANGEYLGLGCAAHSRLGMARLMNDCELDGYMARVEATGSGQADLIALTPMDDAFDTLMLGTRTLAGVALDAFAARHGRALLEALRPELDRLISQGLAEPDAARFRLTERGLMLQNTVLVDIMEAFERIS